MNKSELVDLVSDKLECSKADGDKALKAVVDSITEALSRGKSISLIGFGSFSVQSRAARNGRNPKTGEPIHIAAYKQPTFKAGKKLKDSVQ